MQMGSWRRLRTSPILDIPVEFGTSASFYATWWPENSWHYFGIPPARKRWERENPAEPPSPHSGWHVTRTARWHVVWWQGEGRRVVHRHAELIKFRAVTLFVFSALAGSFCLWVACPQKCRPKSEGRSEVGPRLSMPEMRGTDPEPVV